MTKDEKKNKEEQKIEEKAPQKAQNEKPKEEKASQEAKSEKGRATKDEKEKKVEKPKKKEEKASQETQDKKEKESKKVKTADKKDKKTKEAKDERKEDEKATKLPTDDKSDDKTRWYVIHTYSGHENKAAEALKQRIDAMGLKQKIFDIVVPTRNVVLVRHGKKHESKEKIFPGYILVRMALDDESWLAVRTTPGVTSFIGTSNKPTPISNKEVEAIMKFMSLEAPKFKAKFTVGEAVKIVDGPFADFLGTVESIDEARGKVKVLVSIFGRETPVELDFLQVTKL